MKQLFRFFFITCLFVICFVDDLPAHEKLDSLQNKLLYEPDDSIRLVLLNEIAWELRINDPAKAIQLIDSVIILAKNLDIPTCLAEAYNHLGVIYANAGDHKTAIDWIFRGKVVSDQINDSLGIAKAYNSLGLVYWHQERLDKALEYINLSAEIHQKEKDPKYLAIINNNQGAIFMQQQKFALAEEHFKIALNHLKKSPNHILEVKTRLNLAEVLIETNNLKQALVEIGLSEKICATTDNIEGFCGLNILKGLYFAKENNKKQAERKYLDAIKFCDEVKNYKIKLLALTLLSELYKEQGEYKKAYEYKEKHYGLKDSLANVQGYLLLSRLELEDKLDKQKRVNQSKELKQKEELDFQKRIRNFLLFAIFIILSLGVVALIIYRQKLKNAKILDNQRQEIILKNEILREQMEQDKEKTELIEFINEENEILSLVAKETDNSVFILSPEGKIEWVNEAFQRLSGYSFGEFKRLKGMNIYKASSSKTISMDFTKCVKTKRPVTYVSKTETKHKKTIWIHTTLTPVLDDKNEITKIIAIDTDITKVKEAEEQLAKKNLEITWSLQYARKIQKALLPLNLYMKSLFPQYFVINLPQNIVSGDFFWVANKNNQTLAAVADSTGHGVPGAFMSLLGISSLQEVIGISDDLTPEKLLGRLRDKIVYLLNAQEGDDSTVDSLDIAICVIDNDSYMLRYAGSNNPVFILRDDVLIELKPDKYFIWDPNTNQKDFTLKKFQLKPDDKIYMLTDGFSDQFGGESDKKYSRRRLKKLLLDVYALPMETQKDLIRMELKNWQGTNEQIDDILVLAFQV